MCGSARRSVTVDSCCESGARDRVSRLTSRRPPRKARAPARWTTTGPARRAGPLRGPSPRSSAPATSGRAAREATSLRPMLRRDSPTPAGPAGPLWSDTTTSRSQSSTQEPQWRRRLPGPRDEPRGRATRADDMGRLSRQKDRRGRKMRTHRSRQRPDRRSRRPGDVNPATPTRGGTLHRRPDDAAGPGTRGTSNRSPARSRR